MVHNVRMYRPFLARTSLAGLGLALTATLAGLSGCGSSQQAETGSGPTATVPAASATDTSSTAAPGLTPPGTKLKIGQKATVEWKPDQSTSARIRLAVTGIEHTTIEHSFKDWQLSSQERDSNPYFINASVTNLSHTDLGGRTAPLYGLDDEDFPYQPADFDKVFKPCPNADLPKKFMHGDTAKVCLVILVRNKGKLAGAIHWPDEHVGPISWTGPITEYGQKTKKSGQKAGQKKQG